MCKSIDNTFNRKLRIKDESIKKTNSTRNIKKWK